MEKVDFAIGWPVEEKKDLFINALQAEARARNLSFAIICESSLKRFSDLVKKHKLKILFFLDMASETYNPQDVFTKFVYCLKDSGTVVVADPDHVKFSADKSITHFNLLRAKIPVPYTVVIRNWELKHRLSPKEKDKLGIPFVVKPAMGYGQKGVKIFWKRYSLKEITQARQFSPGDNFLLQEFIKPPLINARPAWFRVFYLFGEIFPCWWNPQTNEFNQVTLEEFYIHKLTGLAQIISEIAAITRIEWFSCEIAMHPVVKKLVVIDYMNDQCAMYPKSEHKDGVPDNLIVLIARRMVVRAWEYALNNFVMSHRAIWFPQEDTKDKNI